MVTLLVHVRLLKWHIYKEILAIFKKISIYPAIFNGQNNVHKEWLRLTCGEDF
jgi:hypothetical protein